MTGYQEKNKQKDTIVSQTTTSAKAAEEAGWVTKSKKLYFRYSLLIMYSWAIVASMTVIYSTLNNYEYTYIYTNIYKEGVIETILTITALPGWVYAVYIFIKSGNTEKVEISGKINIPEMPEMRPHRKVGETQETHLQVKTQ